VNVEAHLGKPVNGGSTDKPVFKAVLIYEDFAAGVRARWFCEKLVGTLEGTLEEHMWNFDVLGIREIRNLAASTARRADVVIVSVSGDTELPGTIRAWLDIWLWILEEETPALVALFNSSASQKIASVRAYLQQLARCRGIDFFQQEITLLTRQESASAVRSSSKRDITVKKS
jgi:hypothetical protein